MFVNNMNKYVKSMYVKLCEKVRFIELNKYSVKKGRNNNNF